MSKNRRKGQRRPRGRRIRRGFNKKAFSGGKIRCPTHPPQFIPIPWYNLIIRFDSYKDISVETIVSRLDQQLGLAANQALGVRVISCRYWAPLINMNADAHLAELRVAFWSLLPAQAPDGSGRYTIQQEVFDYPDQVRRACVGFCWPKAQQEIVFNRQSNQPVYHTMTGGGEGSVTYIKVLWRALDFTYADVQFHEGKFVRTNDACHPMASPPFEHLSLGPTVAH